MLLLHVCELLVWGQNMHHMLLHEQANAAGSVVAALAVLTSERTAMQGMLTDCFIFSAGPASSS